MRLLAITVVAALLGACTGTGQTEYCYKSMRSLSGKSPRALVAVPCPPADQAAALNLGTGGATAG